MAPSVAGLNATVAAMRGLTSEKDLSDDELAWFGRDRKGDAVAAVAKAERYAAWRRAGWGGLAPSRQALKRLAAREASKRVGYLAASRDKLGRPVVVVVARRHSVPTRDLKSSQALCIDVLESAVEALDGIEQFSAVVDLRGVGAAQVDIQFVIWLVNTLRGYYPKRLGQIALVDPPMVIFNAAWSLITPYLGKHANMVKVTTKSEIAHSYFRPSQLPHDLR